MSKEIFKNITNFINDYPLLLKKEILNKLLELVGDKEDKYYEEFFDIYIKEFKLKNICVINFHISNKNKVIYFNNFKNIYEFIEIIKDYYNSDLLKEIKNLLDNIFITPPSSPKPIEHIPPPSPKPDKSLSPKSPRKKIPIPIALKIKVWDKCIGLEIGKHKCLCCKTIDIIQMSFHCGNIIPECKGGETILSNLKPICQQCNLSMGTKNMDEFIKKFK